MKKITFHILSAIALLTSVSAVAQNRIGVRQDTFALIGDTVHVEMAVNLNNTTLSGKQSVLLTPYLKSGETTMDLPSVMVNGSTQHKAYERLVALKKAPSHIQTEINAGKKNAPQAYKYTARFAYEPWMMNAEFFVREDQCECNGPLAMMSYELMAKKMEDRNPPLPPPYVDVEMSLAVSYIVPKPEPTKQRSETGKAYLDFPVGKSILNPDFGNNAAELAKIDELIRRVKKDPYAKITKITVEGYASPEGSSVANHRLSSNRATALKNNLKRTYGFRESEMMVAGRGEDWAGFEKLIEESSEERKERLLEIIRSAKLPDVKERELRALGNVFFKTLTEEYFPRLRRTDYELSFVVVPLTIDQSKEILQTNPRNLSLNEMFLVAQTYPAGSEEYNEVFEIAARVFPDNDVSLLNAAANALARNDIATAEKFLNKVANHDAAYHNNLGVLHSLKREYDIAAKQYSIAKEKGSAEAVHNISELDKMKQAETQLTAK